MKCAIHHMRTVQYFRDKRPSVTRDVLSPAWEVVEADIRRMDNFFFPVVYLNPTEHEDCEDQLCIIGGNNHWALFRFEGEWCYEDTAGSDAEVRLWQSDQGCFCKEKNLLTDVENVLKIAKIFYETASYEDLDEVV